MAKGNLIRDEAFDFALRIMKLAKRLRMEKEFELSSQLWRGWGRYIQPKWNRRRWWFWRRWWRWTGRFR